MGLRQSLLSLVGRGYVNEATPAPACGYRKLVIILDGTLSKLDPGCETNAGLAFKLLKERAGDDVMLYYEAGLQWSDWRDTLTIMTGHGINEQIKRAYGWLASNYRRGDRIYLVGYSRGAYAARSLAGVIGRVGLVRRQNATERNLRDAFRLYCAPERVAATQSFAQAHCHGPTQVECVAVWDTVKALGIRLPLIWMITNRLHRFHGHRLGEHVRAGYHAMALHETRRAYAPVLWKPGQTGAVGLSRSGSLGPTAMWPGSSAGGTPHGPCRTYLSSGSWRSWSSQAFTCRGTGSMIFPKIPQPLPSGTGLDGLSSF